MAQLSDHARLRIDELADDFRRKGRYEAIDRLADAVDAALRKVDRIAAGGRRYPAVYKNVEISGFWWIKVHRYWFAYTMDGSTAVISHVFYDQADIPGRFRP